LRNGFGAGAVDAKADAGMYGDRFAVFGDEIFCLDVEALSDFAGACFAEFSFSNYVRGHLDRLAVGEGLEAGIDSVCRASQLDVQGACQEKRAESEGHCEPLASAHEVQACSREEQGCRYPP
jgi:hypothetical protein